MVVSTCTSYKFCLDVAYYLCIDVTVLMLLYAMFETKQGIGQAELLSEQQLHVYDLLWYH